MDGDRNDALGTAGGEAVEDLLKKTSFERDMFVDSPRGRIPQGGTKTPSAGDAMASLLMGGAIYEKLKELTDAEPTVDSEELRRELGLRRNGDRK